MGEKLSSSCGESSQSIQTQAAAVFKNTRNRCLDLPPVDLAKTMSLRRSINSPHQLGTTEQKKNALVDVYTSSGGENTRQDPPSSRTKQVAPQSSDSSSSDGVLLLFSTRDLKVNAQKLPTC